MPATAPIRPGRGRRQALVSALCAVMVSVCLGDPAPPDGLKLKAGVIHPGTPRARNVGPQATGSSERASGSEYRVVQLRRQRGPRQIAALRALGAEVAHYLSGNAFIVRVPAKTEPRLRTLPGIRWVGPLDPRWKLSPRLKGLGSSREPIPASVDLFPGEDLASTAAMLRSMGLDVLREARFSDTSRLHVRGTPARLEQAAQLPGVAWIEQAGTVTLRNDDASWVIQSNTSDITSIWDRGLHGEGEILGVIDGAIDLDSCFFEDPANPSPGPTHRKVVSYRSTFASPPDTHGTHVAGTAAGDAFPVSGTTEGNGHAYAARIAFADVLDIEGSGAAPSNLYPLLTLAHGDGARIHTNSWGDDSTSEYTTWSRDADLFSHDHEDSLVIFAVTNLNSLRSPENAKNVLAVAATFNGTAASTFCSGGAGPTNDGRRKPDIVAPGCNIRSARSDRSCSTQLDSGTSMAAPAVAGAAALVRQYFREGWYPSGTPSASDARVPSGALLRAVLLNSAVDLTGLTGFPGDREGWGRLLLEEGLFFEGDRRRLALLDDRPNVDGLVAGNEAEFLIAVDGSDEPLEITLVYTDPPASLLASSATVNDLDLEVVSPSGALYRGNFLDPSGSALPDGTADAINTVETVRLPTPELGNWGVIVRASAVPQGPQGFALVATGQVTPLAVDRLRYQSYTVLDDGALGNGNGELDPGETVTLPVSLVNLRARTASAVQAELGTALPDWIAVTAADAAFPDFAPGGSATSLNPHFRLTVAPDTPCGTVVPLDLDIRYAEGESASSFLLTVGSLSAATPGGSSPREATFVCEALECPGDPVPGPIDPRMTVEPQGNDLLLSWPALAGAQTYRIWGASTPDFARERLLGETPATTIVLQGLGDTPENGFFRVRAVNSCNWEGH